MHHRHWQSAWLPDLILKLMQQLGAHNSAASLCNEIMPQSRRKPFSLFSLEVSFCYLRGSGHCSGAVTW